VKCQAALGFLPDLLDLSTLESAGEHRWQALTPTAGGRVYRPCQNQIQHQVCNWLIPDDDPNPLCRACRHNDTIPDLSVADNLIRWNRLEIAKRRLFYTLLHLGLSVDGHENKPRLRFSFVQDRQAGPSILTGHSQGLITINVAEADDAVREQRRTNLHEPYRTLLGHFRHEVGHFYWDQLIAQSPGLKAFRNLFGDETQDYSAALQAYYRTGAPADWALRHVSAYASAHPWEDWAETWAHYLHIRDTVETAASFGLRLNPRHPNADAMTAEPGRMREDERDFGRILKNWLPVTFAVNELNRGMGLPDVYPFILSDRSVEKLRFVHQVILNSLEQAQPT
jgi:hypothetical protein